MNILAAIIKYLLPSATREHVLGDLRERYSSPFAFMLGAAATLPYVLLGQARRNIDLRLTLVEAAVLISSFGIAAFRVFGDGLSGFLTERNGLERILAAALAGLVALMLGDTYVEIQRRARFHVVRQWALAYAASAICSFLIPPLTLPFPVFKAAAATGFVFICFFRILLAELFIQPRFADQLTSLDSIRRDAAEFYRRIRQRNLTEYAGVIALTGWNVATMATAPDSRLRLAAGFGIACVLFVAYQLHKRARANPVPKHIAGKEFLTFYRAELVRQHRALLSVEWWYLAPLVLSIVTLALARANGDAQPWRIPAILLGTFVLAWIVRWLNRVAERKLLRKITALDQLEKQA